MSSGYLFMENGSIIIDFELKEDLVNSYTNNPDITFVNLNIKDAVEEFEEGTVLEVEKKIGSPITILSIKEVSETALPSAFID